MLTLAGERGWIPMSINIVPTKTLIAQWDTYSGAGARVGRPADRANWRICRDVFVGKTSAQAREAVIDGVIGRDWREYFLPLLRKGRMMIAPKIDPAMPDEAVTIEYLCDNLWIVGDVDEVTRKLRTLHDDVGGFGTLLVIGHEGSAHGDWGQSMRLLAEEVAPRIP